MKIYRWGNGEKKKKLYSILYALDKYIYRYVFEFDCNIVYWINFLSRDFIFN